RPVQTAPVGPAERCPGGHCRRPREDVRLPVRATARDQHPCRHRSVRAAAAPVACTAAPGRRGGPRRSGGGRVSEQSTGFGPFLFGVVIGAALGFLFAPEAGAASRTKLARRVRELAAEKI